MSTSPIDASSYQQLSAALEERSGDELLAALEAQEGGVDHVLDQVFAGMVAAFNPARAGGQEASVQYEIDAPGGPRRYVMRVADGRCQAERGTAEAPRVTLRLGLVDFLRLVTGKLNGMQAFMTGKLKLSGDLFFAQTYQTWFDRPA